MRGESEARVELTPAFAERYFGYRPLLWNRRQMESRAARRSAALLSRELVHMSLRERAANKSPKLWMR